MNLTNPIYHNEDKAREHLESIRWPKGAACPHCGECEKVSALEGKSHRPGLYKCYSCAGHFTVTVGTVFERSKIALHKWVLAAHLIASSKKGFSAHQLHRTLEVSYKTAWFMMHRLRKAMEITNTGPLGSGGGTVEADETYWGNTGKQRKGARGYQHKMKVLALVERDGKARGFVVTSVNGKTLKPILQMHIDQSATVNTDEHGAYTGIGKHFAKHEVVNHKAGEYSRGDATTNTVEGYFSILKRGLVGTFHHVGEQHLHRYIAEFDFRYNTRAALGYTDSERAALLLKNADQKRLTYY